MSAPDPDRRRDPADAPLHWAVKSGAVDDVIRAMDARVATRRRQRRRLCLTALATTVVSLLALGAFLHVRPAPDSLASNPPHTTTPLSALVLRPEKQTLPDGSTVELKPGAQISVAFTAHARRVTLVSGEAHFQVGKNLARPFVVTAGATEFRAVGTAFTVDLTSAAAELVVTEGRVAVDQPGAAPSADLTTDPQTVALVTAGNKLLVPSAPLDPAAPPLAQRIEPLAPPQLDARLAWRVPRLEFNGTPLAEALPLFNQHSRVRLSLGDPALTRVRLSGSLRADNVDTLLALLEETHGIQIEKRGPHEIVLRKRR